MYWQIYISLVKPKIKTPLKDIFIRAGTVLHVDIDFIGEPPPEVTWTVNGSDLKPDNRTTITSIGYHTIMNRVNSKRIDSGTYNLLLKNSSGTDEGSFNVTVLGMKIIFYYNIIIFQYDMHILHGILIII